MLIDPGDAGTHWLLVRSKPKQERVLVASLATRAVAAYCPLVLEPKSHRRSPHGPVPLFTSYVFARCAVAESYAAVHYCPGAAGIVRFGDVLAAVEDDFVSALQAREGGRGYLVIGDARRRPQAGSHVRIEGGPLEGLQGIVERYLPSKDRVRLLLELVRGTRRVEVEASHVRPASRQGG